MENSGKSDTVKTVNYTDAMVETIAKHAPINLAIARELGKKLGKSYQSIIAKCKTEGIEYVKLAPPSKKVAKVTKAELVAMIEVRLDRTLDGLEKSTSKSLLDLLNGIQHVQHSETENAE